MLPHRVRASPLDRFRLFIMAPRGLDNWPIFVVFCNTLDIWLTSCYSVQILRNRRLKAGDREAVGKGLTEDFRGEDTDKEVMRIREEK